MFRLYIRTIMLGFIVIFLARNIAPATRGGSSTSYYNLSSEQDEVEVIPVDYEETKYEISPADEISPEEIEALSLTTPVETKRPMSLKGLILDQFANPKTKTFKARDCCYYYILKHFNENESAESCVSFAMLNLTVNMPHMTNNIYARPYYYYLENKIYVGGDMRSPKQYCEENPVRDDITPIDNTPEPEPEPSSSRLSFKQILKKISSKKVKNKDQNKDQNQDARVRILEKEFRTTAEKALETIYRLRVISLFEEGDIKRKYMEHIDQTVGIEGDTWSPWDYCVKNYPEDAPLDGREPIYGLYKVPDNATIFLKNE